MADWFHLTHKLEPAGLIYVEAKLKPTRDYQAYDSRMKPSFESSVSNGCFFEPVYFKKERKLVPFNIKPFLNKSFLYF